MPAWEGKVPCEGTYYSQVKRPDAACPRGKELGPVCWEKVFNWVYLPQKSDPHMPILDLYNHSEQRRNLAHFAALASLAAVDGEVNPEEKAILDRFANKLNITEAEYREVMKKENKYPVEAPFEMEKRYERLFDFFRLIYSDHAIDQEEMALVRRYAIGVGFSADKADAIIARSVAIFSGRVDFDDYLYLMKQKK
jgi:uncharacterized tellurite resistance protein B-like protein